MNFFYPVFRVFEWGVNALMYAMGLIGRQQVRTGSTPKRVLIARYDMIGDFVLFTATLPLYRVLFKEARLVLLVRDSVFEIARHTPYVDEVWRIPNKRFRFNPLERLRWFRRMRNYAFDIAINAVYSTSWVHLDCLVGWTYAARRIAHECSEPPAPRVGRTLFFTELVPNSGNWRFSFDRDFQIPAYLGVHGEPGQNTEIHISDADRKEVSSVIPSHPYAVVVPGAREAIRRWGAENFVDTIVLTEPRRHVEWMLCGNRSESALCGEIAEELRARSIVATNLAGQTSLAGLCALTEHAEFFLGNESGPLHLAIALGVPAVCVTGGGMFGICFPYPKNPLAIPVLNRLPCYGCRWHCTRDEPECITKIRPPEVADTIARVINAETKRRITDARA